MKLASLNWPSALDGAVCQISLNRPPDWRGSGSGGEEAGRKSGSPGIGTGYLMFVTGVTESNRDHDPERNPEREVASSHLPSLSINPIPIPSPVVFPAKDFLSPLPPSPPCLLPPTLSHPPSTVSSPTSLPPPTLSQPLPLLPPAPMLVSSLLSRSFLS
jgi:hypothetical protein